MCLTNWETSEPTVFFFLLQQGSKAQNSKTSVGKEFYFSGKGLTKGKAGKQTMLFILW